VVNTPNPCVVLSLEVFFCDAIKNLLEVLVNLQNIIKLPYFGLQFHFESKVWRVASVGEQAILFLVITCLSHTEHC